MRRIFFVALFTIAAGLSLQAANAEKKNSSVDPSMFTDVTIKELVSEPKEYNGTRVRLEGFVEEVDYTKSSKGEPFTLFRMNDGNGNEVRVYYEDEHLPLSDGDKVQIQGRYKKQKKYFLYKIKNVIKARTVKEL